MYSLKSTWGRHPNDPLVRRRDKLFAICKNNPRFKARMK
ncbi:ribosomal protein bL36 [Aeromonas sp. 164P]